MHMRKPCHLPEPPARFNPVRLLWLLVAVLPGCSTITTHDSAGEAVTMSQEEFAQYVEHVFRYHNQVMSELIESAEDRAGQNAAETRRLDAAEKSMVDACEPLNEIVSESLSGEEVGLTLKMDLADTVPACEAASKAVEELIP